MAKKVDQNAITLVRDMRTVLTSNRIKQGEKARLLVLVSYEDPPDPADLEEILDKLRELGGIEVALWEHAAYTIQEL